MDKVTSNDSTTIAYEKNGSGPAVILVDGATAHRGFSGMSELSKLLASNFTVYTYDRRGRGESSDTKPFAVEREIEDIEVLIEQAGGKAFVFGISSGACLALEAAIQLGNKIEKLAMYEPPYDSEEAAQPAWKEYREQLAELLAEGRRDDAITLFMRFVGTPEDRIEGMRQQPMWPVLESVAPTLEYDAAAIGAGRSVPIERAAKVTVPVLVMDGGENLTIMPFMHATATALARAIPHAQQRTLEGQSHDVNMAVLAPVLVEFFK